VAPSSKGSRGPIHDLEKIYDRVRADSRWDHLRAPGARLVPGFGPLRPMAMIVGEAPGATENTLGRPFCGAAGRVLEGLMESAGLWAEPKWSHGSEKFPETTGEVPPNAYLTNVVKYRPMGNRTPTPDEITWGTETLRAEWVALGSPRLIVAVGTVAKVALLSAAGGPGEMLRSIRSMSPGNVVWRGGAWIYAQYHPAFGLRQPNMRPVMEQQWEAMGKWMISSGEF